MRQVSRQPQPASGASGKRTLWEYTVSVEEAVESRVETTDTITILSIETEGEDPFLLPGRSIAFIARAADDTSGTRMLVLSGFHGMVQISADDTLSRRCPANVAGGTSWQQADGTAVGKRTADFIDMLRGRPQPASNHE